MAWYFGQSLPASILYGITDTRPKGGELFTVVEEALLGGVNVLQLRDKALARDDLIAVGKELAKLCHQYDVPLIINDDYEIALACGADGVHVGVSDTAVSVIRANTPNGFLIGATAKTPEQARTAEQSGADYLGVGAMFPSPTKVDAIRLTRSELEEIARSVTLPIVAIGGITCENVTDILIPGIAGIAVVSAVFASDTPRLQAQALCRTLAK